MKKIVKLEGRIILIESELTDKQYWRDLIDSLTFTEGMTLITAINDWMIDRNLVVKQQVKNNGKY